MKTKEMTRHETNKNEDKEPERKRKSMQKDIHMYDFIV